MSIDFSKKLLITQSAMEALLKGEKSVMDLFETDSDFIILREPVLGTTVFAEAEQVSWLSYEDDKEELSRLGTVTVTKATYNLTEDTIILLLIRDKIKGTWCATADALGISRSFVSAILLGKRKVSNKILQRAAKLLGYESEEALRSYIKSVL